MKTSKAKHVKCEYKKCKDAHVFKEFIYDNISVIDPKLFMDEMKSEISNLIEKQKWSNIKIQLALKTEFYKKSVTDYNVITNWFNSGTMKRIMNNSEIDSTLNVLINKVDDKIVKFTQEGSGWIVDNLSAFSVKLAKYRPLRGSSFIPLPEKYQHHKFKLINT